MNTFQPNVIKYKANRIQVYDPKKQEVVTKYQKSNVSGVLATSSRGEQRRKGALTNKSVILSTMDNDIADVLFTEEENILIPLKQVEISAIQKVQPDLENKPFV